MCRSENEPNGPYRCSADMMNALMSTKAHYAQAVLDKQKIEEQAEHIATQCKNFQDIVGREEDAPKEWIKSLEELEQRSLALNAERDRLHAKASEWQAKLREAQKNYDSTRGGVQDLCEEYNAMVEKLKNEDLSDEDKKRLLEKTKHLKNRMQAAIGTIEKEREKPWAEEAERHGATEGIRMAAVDNSVDAPSMPNGDESDVLMHPEVDAALNNMIDDLELSAVDKKYMGLVDPNTGEKFDEHELQIISRRNRREARMRLQRQREADGDTRELLRSFIRNALYRSLRYNKATRKFVRLVGIKQYNDILAKIDDIQFEHRDKKIQLANQKWKKQRQEVANKEFNYYESQIEDAQTKCETRTAQLQHSLQDGKVSKEQHDLLMQHYQEQRDRTIKPFELAQTEIELARSEWAMEEVEEVRLKEKRAQNIAQAMIERKRQQEFTQELIDSVRT